MGRNHLTGACLTQKDATNREKYLKTYHGKMFLKGRLKSYLTGVKLFLLMYNLFHKMNSAAKLAFKLNNRYCEIIREN